MLPIMHRDELFSDGAWGLYGNGSLPRFGLENPVFRPSLFTYSRVPSVFPRVPQLPSRSRFTSFSCITAPVAVHTAVSLYSWSHANINAGFLTAQKRQVLSSRLHWHLNFLLLIADGLMADNNIDDRVFLLPCLWCLRSSPSSPSKTIRIHLLPLLFWWMRCTPYRFD